MTWWLWLLFGFGLIAFEMFLPLGFAFLIIGLSFLITGTFAGIWPDAPMYAEWLVCVLSFVVLFATARKPLMKLFGLDAPSAYNEGHGQEIKIISIITAGETGQGEMQGTQWKVRNIGTEVLKPGEVVKVIKIDGLTVEVKK